MSIAQGIFPYTLGGKEYSFGLLSVEDLITIMNHISRNDILDLDTLFKATKNPQWCDLFLLTAGKKSNDKLTAEDVRKMGSILGRVKVAVDIYAKSIINGEEPVAEASDVAKG